MNDPDEVDLLPSMPGAATMFAALFWCDGAFACVSGLRLWPLLPPVLAALAIAGFYVWSGWRAGDEDWKTSVGIISIVVTVTIVAAFFIGRGVGLLLG